ncbi:MAG: polysaccharide biosynthesis/export family protein [Muribaculaceae bacterium]|nr:polysaccharide biosynthesis/export family protein [Muribaculaceae bacterium]
MNISKILRNTLGLLFMALVAGGCSTPKDVAYFQGTRDAEVLEIASAANKEIRIQPHDRISITVTCKDPALAKMFNLEIFANSSQQRSGYNGTGSEFRDYSVSYSEGLNGFTVSSDGTIDYPVLGKIKVAGYTRSELAAFIKGEIMGRGLIKDPIVNVEFLNVGFSVLGEVAKPGRYDLNSDYITIVEALSLAGDMTIQGQRENVKVLRKDGDKMQTYIINLTDAKQMAASPVYYLKQDDVVYVEPNTIRKRQTTSNGNNVTNVSFWLSVASLLTSAAILFKK